MKNMKNDKMYPYISQVVKEKLEYTDCDGCTRAIAYMLDIAGVKFKIWLGSIRAKGNPGKMFPIHYWIETDDGTLWDFKSYKWLAKDPEDCLYKKEADVTDNFVYTVEIFNVLIKTGNTIGKRQDEMFEKQTGIKLHRRS